MELLLYFVLVGLAVVLLGPWFMRTQRAGRRAIDISTLWPICVEKAPDLNHAKAAFAQHVFHDPAWTRDYTQNELERFIDKLEAP